MVLTTSDKINIGGICASALLSAIGIVLAILVFRYAKKKDKVIGPIFSVFGIEFKNSEFSELDRYGYKTGTKTVVAIDHLVINDGDRTTIFDYKAILKLDIHTADGERFTDIQKISYGEYGKLNIFKPGVYQSPVTIFFYFENPEKKMWTTAALRFKGYFYNHERKKVTIDTREFEIINESKPNLNQNI